jgi:hypothetical protein
MSRWNDPTADGVQGAAPGAQGLRAEYSPGGPQADPVVGLASLQVQRLGRAEAGPASVSGREALWGGGGEKDGCAPAPAAWRRCLKRPGRAVRKALLHYDGDVSRLLDVCRARIAFDAVGDLEACARRVFAAAAAAATGDGGALRIRRVRNSMRPGYDGVLSDGFRVAFSARLPFFPRISQAASAPSSSSVSIGGDGGHFSLPLKLQP